MNNFQLYPMAYQVRRQLLESPIVAVHAHVDNFVDALYPFTPSLQRMYTHILDFRAVRGQIQIQIRSHIKEHLQ